MDIREIIQKLSAININDLKNLDVNKIKAGIFGRPHIMINAVLIFTTVIASIHIFTSQKTKARSLQAQIPQLQDKLKKVEESKEENKKIEKFFQSIPETLGDDRFADKISELAVTHGVQILSFLPPTKSKNGNIEISILEMDISSEKYNQFLNFITAIETLPFTVRLSELKVSLGTNKDESRSDTDGERPIQAHLEVNSVTLKK